MERKWDWFELSPCALYNNDCDYRPRTNEGEERKTKLSLSYLVRADADGTEKFSLYDYWEIKTLLCFKKKSGQELGIWLQGGLAI